VKLWDIATGKEIRTFRGHTNSVFTAAFSPDGRRLASASRDQTVKLWDINSGEEVFSFVCHDAAPSACFSPDGRWLAACTGDSVIVFDSQMQTPEKMGRFLARQLIERQAEPDKALETVRQRTNWSEAMREAAIKYIHAVKGP
jgi:WD40 repeat protein